MQSQNDAKTACAAEVCVRPVLLPLTYHRQPQCQIQKHILGHPKFLVDNIYQY